MFYELEAVLLVNKNIGSTVEVLTIGLKEYKPTKIIEEKTTGGLLSAQQFKLDNNIMLYVPVNDFVSYGGYRVDKKGVKPDIKNKK
jgi:C-terminal processing protease CtpA/Prc